MFNFKNCVFKLLLSTLLTCCKLGKDLMKKSLSTTLTKELMISYTNNALTGNFNLLVLFLINNNKVIRLTRTHPESSLDGNQKSFNLFCAYIPNAQSWVFNLMFYQCLPFF